MSYKIVLDFETFSHIDSVLLKLHVRWCLKVVVELAKPLKKTAKTYKIKLATKTVPFIFKQLKATLILKLINNSSS